jgi:hypothetical protein
MLAVRALQQRAGKLSSSMFAHVSRAMLVLVSITYPYCRNSTQQCSLAAACAELASDAVSARARHVRRLLIYDLHLGCARSVVQFREGPLLFFFFFFFFFFSTVALSTSHTSLPLTVQRPEVPWLIYATPASCASAHSVKSLQLLRCSLAGSG